MARKRKTKIQFKRAVESIRRVDWDRNIALFAGVSISIMSAWYSVAGLMAIFSGAALSIMLMGIVLEMGKVVTASYLYRNWTTINRLMKTYFTVAVIFLMGITSIGTFGYLSRAHIQQSAESNVAEARIERINREIQRQENVIVRSENALTQFDSAIDSLISQDYASRALTARETQQRDRASIQQSIVAAETRIEELLDERAPYDRQVENLELEVGPIRYVAEIIYGDSNADLIEKAVRWLIIILVIVFDPLAVLLIMVATKKPTIHRLAQTDYDAEAKGWLTTRKSNVVATDGDKWVDIEKVSK